MIVTVEKSIDLKKTVFRVICPKLKCEIILYENTWKDHILTNHPETESYLALFKKLIEECDDKETIWQKKCDFSKLCIVKEVPHFQPQNTHVKIAIKIISDEKGVITTIHPISNLPGKGMVRYDV